MLPGQGPPVIKGGWGQRTALAEGQGPGQGVEGASMWTAAMGRALLVAAVNRTL